MICADALAREPLGLSPLVGKGFQCGHSRCAGCRVIAAGGLRICSRSRNLCALASPACDSDRSVAPSSAWSTPQHPQRSLDGEHRGYFRRSRGKVSSASSGGLNGLSRIGRNLSRVILMQVIWNLLVRGQWTLADGVDRIPETIASRCVS